MGRSGLPQKESLESGMGLSLFYKGMPGRYGVGAGEAAGVKALWKTETKAPGRIDSGPAFIFPMSGTEPGAD